MCDNFFAPPFKTDIIVVQLFFWLLKRRFQNIDGVEVSFFVAFIVARYLTGDTLKLVPAEFATLSWTVLLLSEDYV